MIRLAVARLLRAVGKRKGKEIEEEVYGTSSADNDEDGNHDMDPFHDPQVIKPDSTAVAATKKQASATIARSDAVQLRDDPEARAAFLATFSAEEEKSIMRKVDKRFLIIIGFMYMIKQVRAFESFFFFSCLCMRMGLGS